MRFADYLADAIIKRLERYGMEITADKVVEYAKGMPRLKEPLENPHLVEILRERAKEHIEHRKEVKEFLKKARIHWRH
ncbi:MAG: hypothetical protein D5R97_06775 [Candidatus Syntrophonatronum acetioxidans]|uniref:Uncharacterized protein n=1 Tax=Candidatus Syntrophonatronum acetioxidans TaxID=1795816 RepID=A0A424YDE4_9FIRM|nr:MAG: hypothetical protein D5R97_06775 [Candidatus Syntrophonatronum acetioxidans]